MKNFSISISYVLYAPPAKVFEALTREGIINAWCDGGGSVKEKADGDVSLFGGWIKGKIIKFHPKKKELSYTWKPSEWDKKTQPSIVNFFFKEHPAGTELLIEHTHFPSQLEADKHLSGWTDYVLEPLNDYFTS